MVDDMLSLFVILESDGYNSADAVAVYKYREDAEKHLKKHQWIQEVHDITLKKIK